MTPVNFVAFLLSLCLVDWRLRARREHIHRHRQSRLPDWLHRLIYRPQPYSQVGGGAAAAAPGEVREPFYYHTKQKKLLKMEADEAFRMRRPAIAALSVVVVALGWTAWRVVLMSWSWLYTR